MPRSRRAVFNCRGVRIFPGGTASMADREKGVKEGRIMSTRRFLTSQFTHAAGQNRPHSTRAAKSTCRERLAAGGKETRTLGPILVFRCQLRRRGEDLPEVFP